MAKKPNKPKATKRGPKPETMKIGRDRQDGIKKSFRKKKPVSGLSKLHKPSAVEAVAEWLKAQLSKLPSGMTAMYVEWNNSYHEPNTPREIVYATFASFGFSDIAKGGFDTSSQEDLFRLAEFAWDGGESLNLREDEYPGEDWTGVLKGAAAAREVRAIVRRKKLLFLVGYHDDDVFDVS